jgi:hypothetical protein
MQMILENHIFDKGDRPTIEIIKKYGNIATGRVLSGN